MKEIYGQYHSKVKTLFAADFYLKLETGKRVTVCRRAQYLFRQFVKDGFFFSFDPLSSNNIGYNNSSCYMFCFEHLPNFLSKLIMHQGPAFIPFHLLII